jgi:hypothetical protein
MAIPAFCFNLFEAKKPQKGFPLQSGAIENVLNRKIVRKN